MSLPTRNVMVGLSGGVDSAVAALLLLEQGCQVEALFMKNWEEDDSPEYCSAAVDLEDATAVCKQLGIPLHTINFSAEYWDRVFEYFLAEYRAGRTPNPDVLCNREIKFRAFLDHALQQGADHIATGHYAQLGERDGRMELRKGVDPDKDQSYFLHQLDQRALRHSLFPIGHLPKVEVRRMAAAAGFPNHAKKDSTGICFIGERRFRDFLARYLPAQPGEIRSVEGEWLGEHQGLMYHTIGQRQGLGIGGVQGKGEEPWYVVDKDLERNILVVAQGQQHPALYHQGLSASQLHWISGSAPQAPFPCSARIRYRQQDQDCTIERLDGDRCDVRFAMPQRAISPGQSIVFYAGDVCLGGGIIEGRY
ncbi:MAG TPA: tRNA 2-thiouridine(34) synthase MnmA [Gammaproteobacteria bacterium]|nr:tRNA 2-thiouridine(34) synthase MnmA [Gammaproteobacteria bacterium]